MRWTKADHRIGKAGAQAFLTKKDEGEAFRTGQPKDTPKPLREEVSRDKEPADTSQ